MKVGGWMLEKHNRSELTYDSDGEAAVQQMVTDSYHAGYVEENLQGAENLERT